MAEKNNLGEELGIVLEKMLKQRNIELTKEDIQEIVADVLPDMDFMISQKVKWHFQQIGEFLIKNCK